MCSGNSNSAIKRFSKDGRCTEKHKTVLKSACKGDIGRDLKQRPPLTPADRFLKYDLSHLMMMKRRASLFLLQGLRCYAA